jgi:hypothetical protein
MSESYSTAQVELNRPLPISEEQVPRLTKEQIRELGEELDTVGFARLSGYMPRPILEQTQRFAADLTDQNPGQYVHLDDPEKLTGSGLDSLRDLPQFYELLHGLYEYITGQPAARQRRYDTLRCLAGQGGQRHSYYFHYDAHLVTALVPISIPSTGQPGDLLLFPNTRKVRNSYWVCAGEKAILKMPLTQKIVKRGILSGMLSPLKLTMVPGDLYLFWGYRSFHANAPCDPDKLRATALFQYGDWHDNNPGTDQKLANLVTKLKGRAAKQR